MNLSLVWTGQNKRHKKLPDIRQQYQLFIAWLSHLQPGKHKEDRRVNLLYMWLLVFIKLFCLFFHLAKHILIVVLQSDEENVHGSIKTHQNLEHGLKMKISLGLNH